MSQSTILIGDVVATVGTYQKDGVKKGRTLKLGTLHKTGPRLWLSIQGHLLNTVLVLNIKAATKELGFPTGSEVTLSVLGKDGRPVSGVGEDDVSDDKTTDENATDDIPF